MSHRRPYGAACAHMPINFNQLSWVMCKQQMPKRSSIHILMQIIASGDAIKDIRSAYMHLSHRVLMEVAVILMTIWRRNVSNGFQWWAGPSCSNMVSKGIPLDARLESYVNLPGQEIGHCDTRAKEGAQAFHLVYSSPGPRCRLKVFVAQRWCC